LFIYFFIFLFIYLYLLYCLLISGQPRRFRSHDVQNALTVYTTLVSDGTTGPLYIQTRKPIPSDIELPPETYIEYIPKTKKSSDRRGEEGVIAFLETSFRKNTFVNYDMIISDNEASFKTDLVKAMEAEHRMLDYLLQFISQTSK
jgi:hypothetical protein